VYAFSHEIALPLQSGLAALPARRLSALEVLTTEIREAIMKITNSMLFSMASCITLTQFLTGAAAGPVTRLLGAISLHLVDRISFSPQAS